MVLFDHVSVSFSSGSQGLQDVSFELQNDEFVFLVGRSGAGKTTILNLILRELAPTIGSVAIDDHDLGSLSPRQIQKLRQHIGMVFQDFKVVPYLNVFENVALGLITAGITRRDMVRALTHDALELVKLEGRDHFYPQQLSAGELQRVAIARAIAGDRTILLADEPTGNLDPKTAAEIMEIFERLEGKKLIIIATHNPEIVSRMKKRVIAVDNGKIVFDGKRSGYVMH